MHQKRHFFGYLYESSDQKKHKSMATLSYISVKKFFQKMAEAFQMSEQKEEANNEEEGNPSNKVRVSVNDLKVISSALLHFKKFLLKKKDMERAKVVNEVDERIYQLILAIEKERELLEAEKEQEAIAA